MREMTEKQRIFAEDYVMHGVARRAAIKAGYSDKRAEQQGYLLLNDRKYTHVQEYIAELREKSKSSTVAELKELQEFWTGLVRCNDPPAEMKDRIKASELLGKCHGAFIEKREVTGEVKTTAPVINITMTNPNG